MKSLITLGLLLALINPVMAENEKTFAGELPPGASSILDKISSGAIGSVYIKKICYNQKETVTIQESLVKAKTYLDMNISPQYRNTATVYLNNALEQKMKAFKIAYTDKTCTDLDNLKVIVKTFGFDI